MISFLAWLSNHNVFPKSVALMRKSEYLAAPLATIFESRRSEKNNFVCPVIFSCWATNLSRSFETARISDLFPFNAVVAKIEFAIKIRYSLSVDSAEAVTLDRYVASCEITKIDVEVLSGFERKVTPAPEATALPAPTSSASATPTPTPAATQLRIVSPGAFCTPAGATGRSASGVLYTCKNSSTDTRNRWRQ